MMSAIRSRHNRSLRPVLVSLEDRALLNAAMPHHLHVPAQIHAEGHQVQKKHPAPGPMITPINRVSAGGFAFTNFDGPTPGTNAGTGTNMNGIANSGTSVGF